MKARALLMGGKHSTLSYTPNWGALYFGELLEGLLQDLGLMEPTLYKFTESPAGKEGYLMMAT